MKRLIKTKVRIFIISLSLCTSVFLTAQTNNFPGTTLDFYHGFVNCGVHPSLGNFDQMTMEAWVWLNNVNDDQKIMGNFQDWNNYYVMGVKEGHLFVEIMANGNVISTYNGSILSQEWTHLSFTFSKGNGGNNGTCYGYINGEVVYIKTDVADDPISITTTNGFHFGVESWGSGYYFPLIGKIDEARIWNIARTTEEIRESIYLALSGSETGIVSYWQFNDGAGTWLTDMVGNNNGWLSDMNHLTWVISTIPFGGGTSNTKIVSSTGNVIFKYTNLSMNFTSKTGTDTIIVSRIDTVANIDPANVETTFNRQYWVVNRFGTGTFTTDLTFTVSEDLTSLDESFPSRIKLFTRSSNTDTDWILLKNASAVNAQNNTATFNTISSFSQFIISRKYPDGFPGTALDFDGIDNFVEVSDNNSLDLTNNYTIEAWICPKVFNWLGGIVGKYQTPGSNGYTLRLTPTSPYTGLSFDEMNTETGILEANNWYHVAAVNDNGNRTVYLNGVVQTLTGTPTPVQANADPLTIGVDYMTNGRCFNGKIEEVRIWKVARTEAEIRENMFLSISGAETGIVSYWQFNNGLGITLTDIIGCNNGTLNNMTNDDWVTSTIPFGGGASNTQIVSSTGNITFTNTSLAMDFTSKTGTDTITATRIDTVPNMQLVGVDTTFSRQYWVVNRFGTGTFTTDLTFTVSEDLTSLDESNPINIKLFTRCSISDTNWVFLRNASSVNAQNNTATFNAISSFSQFIISRKSPCDFPGTALDFDGIDDYVNCGNDTSLTEFNQMTIEAWVWLEDANTDQKILGKFKDWDNYYILGVGSGYLYSQIAAGGSIIDFWAGTIPHQEWTHLAVTFTKGNGGNNGTCHGYINGELVYNKTDVGVSPISVSSVYPFRIGASPWDITAWLVDESIDEVRIWNVALTTEEIRENIYLSISGSEAGLVGYWQFNEGLGNTIYDNIYANIGTLHNMTNDDWVTSTIPFGEGTSNTKIVNSTGNVIFTNTGMEMDFTSKTGKDTITVTRIDTVSNIVPIDAEIALGKQYWIVNRFGTGTFSANLTFTVSEDLTPFDESNPSNIRLFARGSNTDTTWAFLKNASMVNAQNNTATFDAISSFSQYIITQNALDNFPGTALYFNGINDSVELANENNFDFGQAFTIEIWLNISTMSAGYHSILSKGNAWEIKMFYSDDMVLIVFGINNNSLFAFYQTETSTMLNKWNHLACVYNMSPPNEYITLHLNCIKGIQE